MQPDIEILPATLSAADKALYEVSIKQRSVDETRAVDIDIPKILIMTRYQLCKQLFHDLPAEFAKKMVESTQAAEDNLSAKVYGEIEFASFFSILQACEPKNGDVFVDLGHGSGKALIAALILCGQLFSRIHGIDIVPQIVEESSRRINKVQSMIDNNDPYKQFLESCLNGRDIHEVVTVETGDLLLEELSLDWTSADIVFANSTCFGFELMRQLSEKANRMKSGAKLVTLTLPVHSTEFELLFKRNYPMSWGIATVFFQRKK
jgi:SAM-dependent methyltransferase